MSHAFPEMDAGYQSDFYIEISFNLNYFFLGKF